MIYVRESNPAIIDKDIYDTAISLLKKRTEYFCKDISKSNYVFSRKLVCSECGSFYRRKVINQKVYWLCIKHNKGVCKCKPIKEEVIKNAFIKVFNRLKCNCDYILQPLIERLKSLDICESQMKEINIKILETKESIHLINKLKKNAEMDASIVISKINEMNSMLAHLNQEKLSMRRVYETEHIIQKTEVLMNLLKGTKAQSCFNDELFHDIVELIKIDIDKNITITLKHGLELKVR